MIPAQLSGARLQVKSNLILVSRELVREHVATQRPYMYVAYVCQVQFSLVPASPPVARALTRHVASLPAFFAGTQSPGFPMETYTYSFCIYLVGVGIGFPKSNFGRCLELWGWEV